MSNDSEQINSKQRSHGAFPTINAAIDCSLHTLLKPTQWACFCILWKVTNRVSGICSLSWWEPDPAISPDPEKTIPAKNHLFVAQSELVQLGLLSKVEGRRGMYILATPEEIRQAATKLYQSETRISPKVGLKKSETRTVISPKVGQKTVQNSDCCLYTEDSQTVGQTIITASRGKWADAQVESIYLEYPRKKDKPAGLRAIAKALTRIKNRGTPDPVSFLRDRTNAYAQTVGPDLTYIKYPATWFNNDCFDEDFSKGTPHASKSRQQREHPEQQTNAEMLAGI